MKWVEYKHGGFTILNTTFSNYKSANQAQELKKGSRWLHSDGIHFLFHLLRLKHKKVWPEYGENPHWGA